jgi:hypothetical protein
MTSPIRAAPSSIENSVCRWRWTKESLIGSDFLASYPQAVDRPVDE